MTIQSKMVILNDIEDRDVLDDLFDVKLHYTESDSRVILTRLEHEYLLAGKVIALNIGDEYCITFELDRSLVDAGTVLSDVSRGVK